MEQQRPDSFKGRIQEVMIGSSPSIVVGGDTGLPFGVSAPNRPVIALEVTEERPKWPGPLLERIGPVDDPIEWARRCSERGADLVCLRLSSMGATLQHRAEECARLAEKVRDAITVPLMVVGSGNRDEDNVCLPAIARKLKGERIVLGNATQENYQVLTEACKEYGHVIIAESPIDINIAKQLNILITEAGLPLDRVLIDPTTGGLGYGIEYTYSIMEKARLVALAGDRMLSSPQVCFVGAENWKTKEASSDTTGSESWGSFSERGLMWEAVAATALLMAGAHIVVMRDPEAASLVKQLIERLA